MDSYLSGDYDLVVQTEAPSQVAGLFLLLQADGHPVESVLCASGHVSGLKLIDGQDVGQNETLLRESLLGQGQKFQLTCQVCRNQVHMLLDERKIVEWEGDFDRLSVTNSWGTSALDGIFGLLAHAPYRIHELKLIPRSDEAKRSVNTVGDRAVAEKLREIGTGLYVRTVSDVHRVYASQPLPEGFFRVIQISAPVWLCDADVPSLAPDLASLRHVDILALGNSDISDHGLGQIANSHNVRLLSLEGTLVQNPLADLAIDKSRIEKLYVNGTVPVPEAFDEIGKCTQLNDLGLGKTGMTDDRLLRVSVLPSLAKLDVSDNPLELNDQVIRHLANFESLSYLSADRISAPEERLMRLSELKQLTSLSLAGTKTTDRVLTELQKLPNLRELKIQETPATEAGVKAFQAAKPDCRVEWSPAP